MEELDRDEVWGRLWSTDAVQPAYYQPGELWSGARHFQPVYYLPEDLRYDRNRDTLLELVGEHVVAVDDHGPVMGVALTVERHRDLNRLSCFGRPLYPVTDAAASEARLAAAAAVLFGRLEELRRQHDTPGYHVRDFLLRGRLSALSERVLRAGGRAQPYFTQVLDLRASLEELNAALRDNHRRILRKRLPQLRLAVVTSDTVRQRHGDLLVELHRIMRGTAVRSDEYWQAVVESIRAGEGFMVLASEDGQEVAAAHFATSARTCSYSTAAHNPANKGAGLSHVVLWRAIEHAKELGCDFFEVGDRVYRGQHPFVADKLHTISHFKSGFGNGAAVRMDVLAAEDTRPCR